MILLAVFFTDVLKHRKRQAQPALQKTEQIPLFLQWDERWGYETYGDDFFATDACGPTTLSMVVCGLSGSAVWNPLEVARFADEQGKILLNDCNSRINSGEHWEMDVLLPQIRGVWAYELAEDADTVGV